MHIQLFGIKPIFLRLSWNLVFINFIPVLGSCLWSLWLYQLRKVFFFYNFLLLCFIYSVLFCFSQQHLLSIFSVLSVLLTQMIFSLISITLPFFSIAHDRVPLLCHWFWLFCYVQSTLLFLMKNLIICCLLSFFNSPVNLCLLWAAAFSSLPLALQASQLK